MSEIPKLKSSAKAAIERRPWLAQQTVYRHAVTVYVDTFERSSERVLSAVQDAMAEHTDRIQPAGIVEFEAATAVGCTRIGST